MVCAGRPQRCGRSPHPLRGTKGPAAAGRLPRRLGHMGRNHTVAAAAAALLLTVAACSADTPAAEPEVSAPLAAHGLGGMTGKEIVDHLDRLGGEDRPADLMASVRAEELLVTDRSEERRVGKEGRGGRTQ